MKNTQQAQKQPLRAMIARMLAALCGKYRKRLVFCRSVCYNICIDKKQKNGDIIIMKMRVVTNTNKGKLLVLADRMAKAAGSSYAVDVIPPAYPKERERLVIIVASLSKSMPSSFNIFCNDMNRDRTANVALVVDGTPDKNAEAISAVKENVTRAGARFFDEVLYISGGLPFYCSKKTTPQDETAVDEWLSRVLVSLA